MYVFHLHDQYWNINSLHMMMDKIDYNGIELSQIHGHKPVVWEESGDAEASSHFKSVTIVLVMSVWNCISVRAVHVRALP